MEAVSKKQTAIFKKPKSRLGLILVLLILTALLSIVLGCGFGSVRIDPIVSFKILMSRIPVIGQLIFNDWTILEENIIIGLRLPRVLLGMVVGASLSVCGVTMQALVRNKLADPFLLGVSSGASAFATLGMLFGAFSFLGTYSLSISAFIGAAVTIICVYVLSRVNGRISITQLLLSGVAISMIMDGLTRVIKLSAPNALGLHNAEFWMSGSLAGAKWAYLKLPVIVLIVCLAVLMLNYRSLNMLLMGDDTARALGVDVKRLQKLLILISSLIAGVTIAISGTIGFVGLMVPHFTRLLVGGDHRKVLPISALLGGILVVWVDVLARILIAPEELPVGVLTAIIGGPIFIWMLKRSDRKKGCAHEK